MKLKVAKGYMKEESVPVRYLFSLVPFDRK